MDDTSNNDVIKRASDISNICFDHEENVPIKKEMKQEIKSEIDPSAQFKCGKCEHISSSEASLGMHMRKVHSEPIKKQKKMFSSNLCTKSNPLKDRIGMHLKKQPG